MTAAGELSGAWIAEGVATLHHWPVAAVPILPMSRRRAGASFSKLLQSGENHEESDDSDDR
jgi:hypothetical protein